MRWADERYVRVYTRDTGEWLALGWEAQALFLFALRKADRAGIVQTGKARARGLAGMTGMPLEVVERVLPLLLDDGCLREAPNAYIIPNFIAAQETPTSDAQRKRDQRERDRDKAVADGSVGSKAGLDAEAAMSRRRVTEGGHPAQSRHDVTQDGHAMESRAFAGGHTGEVTPNRAVPSRAVPFSASQGAAVAGPSADEGDRQRTLLDVPAAPPRDETPLPSAETPARRLSAAQEVYEAVQRVRRERCEEAGESYVDDRWHAARVNKDLGAVAKGTERDRDVFNKAFGAFLADDYWQPKGWPLSAFMKGEIRSRYEKQVLDNERGAA